jgi:hypothetical protein
VFDAAFDATDQAAAGLGEATKVVENIQTTIRAHGDAGVCTSLLVADLFLGDSANQIDHVDRATQMLALME